MCPYHIRPTGPIVAPLDWRDPDYDDRSIEEHVDIEADKAEEQYRERKIENDKKSRDGN